MTELSGTSPGAGDPDDEGHHVERAGHGPPVDPHVGAVADVTETLFSELSIKQMQNVSKFGIKLKSKTSFQVSQIKPLAASSVARTARVTSCRRSVFWGAGPH